MATLAEGAVRGKGELGWEREGGVLRGCLKEGEGEAMGSRGDVEGRQERNMVVIMIIFRWPRSHFRG